MGSGGLLGLVVLCVSSLLFFWALLWFVVLSLSLLLLDLSVICSSSGWGSQLNDYSSGEFDFQGYHGLVLYMGLRSSCCACACDHRLNCFIVLESATWEFLFQS